MAEGVTDRLALPLLLAGQAQKEVTHNEALALLDIASCPAVESADFAAPPGAPMVGQCWIVAEGATGVWADHVDALAGWTAGGWRFVAPLMGMSAWVADRGHRVLWNGMAWRDEAVRADGVYQDGVRVLGPRGGAIADPVGGSVVDVESRAAVQAMLAALRTHGMIT